MGGGLGVIPKHGKYRLRRVPSHGIPSPGRGIHICHHLPTLYLVHRVFGFFFNYFEYHAGLFSCSCPMKFDFAGHYGG